MGSLLYLVCADKEICTRGLLTDKNFQLNICRKCMKEEGLTGAIHQ